MGVKKTVMLAVNDKFCKKCFNCAMVCDKNAIITDEEYPHIDTKKCVYPCCKECLMTCSQEAIQRIK